MAEMRRLAAVPLLTVVALAIFAALAWPHPAHGVGVIIIVDSTSDAQDPSHCTLRAAIIAANTNNDVDQCLASAGTGPDGIFFSIGSGTPLVTIGSTPLPTITAPVTIRGNTGGADRVEIRGPGGVAVSGHHGLTIASTAAGTLIRNLVIDNSADDGIEIRAANVTLLGNFIGTNAAGTAAAANLGFGVQVFSSSVHIGGGTSGGPCTGDCNLISGNHKDQVLLDIGENGAIVKGNFIGTDVAGTARIPAAANGIDVKGSNNLIGGTNGTTPGGSCTGDCNVIVASSGVQIASGSAGTQIMGNFFGTDVSGTSGLGGYGIYDIGGDVIVGGTSSSARNLISGTFEGIVTNGDMVIAGNFIGTNAAGTAAVGNTYGVLANGPHVVIGGAAGVIPGGACTGACNLISGNRAYGIDLNNGTSGAVIFGNVIGLQADGVSPLGNSFPGVFIENGATGAEIGGPSSGDGNVVAFNGQAGVEVTGAATTGNSIRGNSIYSNTGKGIDLVSGGNNQLAPPAITGVSPVTGTACAKCTIEVFSDSDGQGKIFEGTSMADNAGNWSFNNPVTGPNVTATATDLANNTSEFSAPFALFVATPTPSPSPTHTPSATPTPTSHPSPTVPPCGSPQYKGDADGNGHVDIHDVLATLSALAHVPPGAACAALAEVDCDNELAADDALRILDYVAGTPLAQPPGCPGVGTLT